MQEHIQRQIWVWNYVSQNCVNVDGIEKNVKLLHSTLGKNSKLQSYELSQNGV
jgi:hypothetical protein